MLWNTGTPDGAQLIDEVLSAILPQYRKNLESNDHDYQSSAQPPVTPAVRDFPPALVGSWSGFVQTYRGQVPLTVHLDSSGALVARLGTAPEVRSRRASYIDGALRWTMPSALAVEGEPFDLAMRLYLHDNSLVGAARSSPPPSSRNGLRASYWVRLDRNNRGDAAK